MSLMFGDVFVVAVPWTLLMITLLITLLAAAVTAYEYVVKKNQPTPKLKDVAYKKVRRIAILIASKNGEATIAQTVQAARQTGRQVYVVSDGSTDRTAQEAKQAGAQVLTLRKNIGKPSALHRAYRHFELSQRFDAIAILDDDVNIEPDFIVRAKQKMVADVAIAVGKNITEWPAAKRWNIWLAARSYSYFCYQLTLRNLQSAFNVMNCISGSNSLYRVAVLDKVLKKHTPYIVDDTYWTLETHRLKLGRIVYASQAVAWLQDPVNFKDWYKQNLRWMWGTFQGIFGHRIGSQFNRFHITYVLLMFEWVVYVASGPLCLWLLFESGIENLPRQLIILSAGYAIWVVVAAGSLKQPRLLFFIPVIVVIDFIFRALMVHAFFKALRYKTVEACVW
ncbi:MAG: glycosyltransferase family 2 protein, partial [Candidatus Saccharimonadales bacterium]